jgi:hypothetical protein
MYNLGNFNSGEDISDNFPLSPSALTLNDPTHPMRMNWCGIINSDEFIWFQLTKIWQLLRFCLLSAVDNKNLPSLKNVYQNIFFCAHITDSVDL